jgi:hypothetical protein
MALTGDEKPVQGVGALFDNILNQTCTEFDRLFPSLSSLSSSLFSPLYLSLPCLPCPSWLLDGKTAADAWHSYDNSSPYTKSLEKSHTTH